MRKTFLNLRRFPICYREGRIFLPVAISLLNLWQILKSDLDRVKTRDCHAIRKHEARNDHFEGKRFYCQRKNTFLSATALKRKTQKIKKAVYDVRLKRLKR